MAVYWSFKGLGATEHNSDSVSLRTMFEHAHALVANMAFVL